MKKPYRRIWLFAAILLLVFAGDGCGQKDQEVLVLLKSQSDPLFDELKTAAEQWAGEENVSIQIVAPKLSSIYEQQKITENSIKNREWDLIVIEALSEDGMYPILDYAKSQGSKIVSMQGMSKETADYTIRSSQDSEDTDWNRENMLLASLEVGSKAADGRIRDTQDKITTQVEGYRTLRLLGDGVYCGNDVSALSKED